MVHLETFNVVQAVVLLCLFLLTLVIVIIMQRYSNKRQTRRLAELKEKLKKIETAVKGVEKDGKGEKKQMLKDVQSFERSLQKP